MHERKGFFIGGGWAAPTGTGWLEVVCPSTEEVMGRVPAATTVDVDAAVEAARHAFDHGPWPRMERAERIDVLRRGLAPLADEVADLAHLMTAQMGAPITWSTAHVRGALGTGEAFLGHVEAVPEEVVRRGRNQDALVWREPVGVVAGIAPWNGPFALAIHKIVPALVAGCTVVYKPAPETPLDAFRLVEALTEAGLPPGAVNVVPAGREVSEHLVRHPGVDAVSFTGSTAAGRRIASLCGERLARAHLELGGKSAAVVLDDADRDTTIASLGDHVFSNSGQLCSLLTRIVVPRGWVSDVGAGLTAAAGALAVGDPFDPATRMGPLVAERQRERVESYIRIGQDEGARLLAGGGRPSHLPRGWYVEPTVFAEVSPSMRIAQEEIFGPVVSVLAYDEVEEAVQIANDSEYGLSGSVFSADPERALAVAGRIRTGSMTVNGCTVANTDAPFGGRKASGIGREFGPEGISGYLELKTVNVPSAVADAHEAALAG